MGGVKSQQLNDLAVHIWSWCIERQIWLSAAHIPGAENDADYLSRNFNDNVEWMLDHDIFKKITNWFKFYPTIDMFASRLNKQLDRFVSWRPDPDAEFIDAFSISWQTLKFYAFPPFSLISRLVRKVEMDQGECIVIVPVWTTQIWFVALLKLLVDYPVLIPMTDRTLKLQNSNKVHPLINKIQLMACRLSGKHSRTEAFLNKLPPSS